MLADQALVEPERLAREGLVREVALDQIEEARDGFAREPRTRGRALRVEGDASGDRSRGRGGVEGLDPDPVEAGDEVAHRAGPFET